ncbi:MAG: helix-turn-helix domain-containing protein [Terriglobia bacterium]
MLWLVPAHEDSFSKAAEREHRTQPSLSAHIPRLEADVASVDASYEESGLERR